MCGPIAIDHQVYENYLLLMEVKKQNVKILEALVLPAVEEPAS